MLQSLRSARSVADGTAQIAGVGHFDKRQAGMLFVVGAQTTIVWAAPLDRGVVHHGHFRFLDEDLAASAVIVDVVGDEDAFRTVFGTPLEKKYPVVLKYDLSFE